VHVLLSKVQYKNNIDIVILNVVTIYFVFDTKRMEKMFNGTCVSYLCTTSYYFK